MLQQTIRLKIQIYSKWNNYFQNFIMFSTKTPWIHFFKF